MPVKFTCRSRKNARNRRPRLDFRPVTFKNIAEAVFFMEKFAGIIRFHRRKAARLTQIELARLAGVGKATVFDIEKGKATVRVDILMKVLATLNLRIELAGPLMEEYEKSAGIRS